MNSRRNHYKTFEGKPKPLPNVAFSELKSGFKGVSLGEEELFLNVERFRKGWRFKLIDIFSGWQPLTAWITAYNVEDLRSVRAAKALRDALKREYGDNATAVLERVITAIQENEEKWLPSSDENEGSETLSERENLKFSEETISKARELLRDQAFFYKLGWVFHHGFVIPKINQPRFIIGEERNKRLLGLLLTGASKLGMTSIIKQLGEPGTAKDTLMRMWLRLLPFKSVERSYLTAASMRYSKEMKKADLLYVPDSPELRGEMGRHMRFMRADDGGLISEYATRDPVTGKILEFAWWLKKQGRSEHTIKNYSEFLKLLFENGAKILNPESVKEALAKLNKSNSWKHNAICAVNAFLKMHGITWMKPKC